RRSVEGHEVLVDPAADLLPSLLINRLVEDVIDQVVVVRVAPLPGDAAGAGLEAATRLRARPLPDAALDIAPRGRAGLGIRRSARRRARGLLERNPGGPDPPLADLRGQVRLQVGDGHLAQ